MRTLYILAFALMPAWAHAQIAVTLPNETGATPGPITLPITVGDLAGSEVLAFSFTVRYDSDVLTIDEVSQTGTLSGAMQIAANTSRPGELRVSAAGVNPLVGSGTLLTLVGSYAGGASSVAFESFMFNEGDPVVAVTGGSVSEHPPVLVTLPPLSCSVGNSFSLDVTVDELTDLDVLAYSFTLPYDNTALRIDEVVVTGTLSQDMTMESSSPGRDGTTRLRVGAASTVPLAGGGTLFTLDGVCLGEASFTLEWEDFTFNEGNPSAITSGSLVEIPTESPEATFALDLAPAYPNPFRTSATILFSLEASGEARLAVYDLLGREIALLVQGIHPAGEQSVTWHADGLSSGTYLVRLEAAGRVETQSVVMLR